MVWWKRNQKSLCRGIVHQDTKGTLRKMKSEKVDSFRLREKNGQKHPAAGYDELPNEVQMYISKI